MITEPAAHISTPFAINNLQHLQSAGYSTSEDKSNRGAHRVPITQDLQAEKKNVAHHYPIQINEVTPLKLKGLMSKMTDKIEPN